MRHQVRRANRRTVGEVLPCGRRKSNAKRQAEENRLTRCLLLLSSVKILTDAVFATSEDPFASWIYDEVCKYPACIPEFTEPHMRRVSEVTELLFDDSSTRHPPGDTHGDLIFTVHR